MAGTVGAFAASAAASARMLSTALRAWWPRNAAWTFTALASSSSASSSPIASRASPATSVPERDPGARAAASPRSGKGTAPAGCAALPGRGGGCVMFTALVGRDAGRASLAARDAGRSALIGRDASADAGGVAGRSACAVSFLAAATAGVPMPSPLALTSGW
eukprot:363634-Chlamydomonas_euryale.AAC.22